MNDFNTYFISSTINLAYGDVKDDYAKTAFSNQERFEQTLLTINSIRNKDFHSKIVLVDNSVQPLNLMQLTVLKNSCDEVIEFEHNLFSQFCNQTLHFNKGVGELLMTELFLKKIRQNNWIGKRNFKVNGRYRLTDNFSIDFYQNPNFFGRYVYKVIPWWFKNQDGSIYWKEFFETKLWSFCGSLIDEYESFLPKIFELMIIEKENIEVSHFQTIPKEKSMIVEYLNLEGNYPNGSYVHV